jgi:hypothetical protein
MALSFSFRSASLLCLLSLHCQLLAQPVSNGAADVALPSYRQAIIGYEPMNLYGLADKRVAGILRDYYAASFGGRESWKELESFRFEGVLTMPQGALHFVAFKKKPDYCKIVLFGGNDLRIVMSYDGADAWQLNTAESAEPSAMPSLEALNFIRDASTGGHLLYPTLPGKQIELLGRRQVDGRDCYDLQVTLPNGQQVIYAIDILDFVERQQIVINVVSGAIEVTTHDRSERVAGIIVPMQSSMTIDGERVHSVQMRSVEVNQGLMPWMFARPSGAYIPGAGPAGGEEADQAQGLGLAGDASLISEGALPASGFFGFKEAPVGAFEPSRFPDLDAETKQSILDDIGDLSP